MDSQHNALIAWAIFRDPERLDPKKRDELKLIKYLYDNHGLFLDIYSIAKHFGAKGDNLCFIMALLNDAIRWEMVRVSGVKGTHYRLTDAFYELVSKEHLERFKAT